MSSALPIHPLTGLQAIGFTRRGPIWPQLGGDGTGDGNTGDAPAADTGSTGGEGDTPPAPESGSGEPASKGNAPESGSGEAGGTGGEPAPKRRSSTAEDPKVRAARNEAATAKQEMADLKQAFGKALGFVTDDGEADPKKLAAQVESHAKDAREAKAELAVFRAAPKDVDTQSLIDSRSFAKKLHGLDPAADDFEQQVTDLVAQEVEKNPRYRLTPAAPAAPKPPARSGADTGSGSNGNSGQLTYEQYKAMAPADRVQAVKDGRANQILGRTK